MSKNSTQYRSVSDERNKGVTERNRKLVTLPYEGTPEVKIKANKLSFVKFIEVAEHYGFDVIKEDAEVFKRILRLK